MRVSYENLLLNASSISATNEDLNQPVTNLYHHYLELPFYSLTQSSVITIDFTATQTIDHIAYGFHNMDSLNIKTYDALLVLTGNIDVTVEENESMYYYTAVSDVKRVVLTASTLSARLYIGSIFLGEYKELPRFIQSPTGGIKFYDNNFVSPGGQSSGNRKRNLSYHSLTMQNITNDERTDLTTYYDYVQRSIPHYIDMYPDSHSVEPVFYGIITKSNIPFDKRRISTWKYNTSITYQEAR